MNFVDFLFSGSVAQPEKAFLLGKEELTYGGLYEKVRNLSSYLYFKYGENNNVIISSPNNAFFIIAYLSVIKSGNVCVPLDPTLSVSNFRYIAEETSPVVIFNSKFSKADVTTIASDVLTEPDLERINSKEQIPHTEFNETRLAEIIFTSGSTGVPKGVMLSHLNLKSNTQSIVEYLELNSNDRVLVVLPFYYCYGLSLLHTHLKCKGSIVINSAFIFLGGVINDLLAYQCTGFAGVPSHFQILLRKTKSFVNTHFPSLRYVTQAGGKLHNVFISEFTQAFTNVSFYVMYGQTEATARLSYLSPRDLNSKLGSIGKAIPGVTLRVVDNDFNDIVAGDTGEIIASGNNIMLGYYKDSELTKQSLCNGWLKTGDLATIDNEGYIFLSARAKEIIKIRGKRVSPKEIEGTISMMQEVIDCSITAFDDVLEGEALQAHIVLRDECKGTITENDVLRFCALHLESYKIPSRITFVEKMLINNAGKKVKAENQEITAKRLSL